MATDWMIPFIICTIVVVTAISGRALFREWRAALASAGLSFVAMSLSVLAWVGIALLMSVDQKNNAETMPLWVAMGTPIAVCIGVMAWMVRSNIRIKGAEVSWMTACIMGFATAAGMVVGVLVADMLRPASVRPDHYSHSLCLPFHSA